MKKLVMPTGYAALEEHNLWYNYLRQVGMYIKIYHLFILKT